MDEVSELLRGLGARLPAARGAPAADAADAAQATGAGVSARGAAPAGAAAGAADPLAAFTDLTLLRPDATAAQVAALCAEALRHGCRAVCVNPAWVPVAVRASAGRIAVCSVAGFPLGATTTEAKVAETAAAIGAGAAEVDVVAAVGLLTGGLPAAGGAPVAADLLAFGAQLAAVQHALRTAAGPVPAEQRVLKVILETCLLDERQKVAGALLAAGAGADFVKTSTGFSSGGATLADIALLRATLGPSPPAPGIKASGGIRDADFARALLAAGATRLGCSSAAVFSPGPRSSR